LSCGAKTLKVDECVFLRQIAKRRPGRPNPLRGWSEKKSREEGRERGGRCIQKKAGSSNAGKIVEQGKLPSYKRKPSKMDSRRPRPKTKESGRE